jgi:hypothetical protein
MYSITIIRFNATTRAFEDTEAHSIILKRHLNTEFGKREAPFNSLSKVLNMAKGDSILVEHIKNNQLWHFYVTKFN